MKSLRGTVFGVGEDGSLLRLEPAGAFAALARGEEDGAWNELGPTRRRVDRLVSLSVGFLARCETMLCASGDGATFTPVELPPGVALDDRDIVAAGASINDFYLTANGHIYHHQKGAWLEEGPRAVPTKPDGSGASSYPDRLRVSVDGTVLFHTAHGSGYATYVASSTTARHRGLREQRRRGWRASRADDARHSRAARSPCASAWRRDRPRRAERAARLGP